MLLPLLMNLGMFDQGVTGNDDWWMRVRRLRVQMFQQQQYRADMKRGKRKLFKHLTRTR